MKTRTNTVLSDYSYVPKPYSLWVGRYARYLGCMNPLHMQLKLGGIVVKDNTFSVKLKQNKKGRWRLLGCVTVQALHSSARKGFWYVAAGGAGDDVLCAAWLSYSMVANTISARKSLSARCGMRRNDGTTTTGLRSHP